MVSKLSDSYMICFVLTASIFCHFVICYKMPAISHITQKTIKDIGDTTELTCGVVDAMDYPILWKKINEFGETVLISVGPTVMIKNTRFSLRINNEESRITLRIDGIQETDAALYRCQIFLRIDKQLSADVELVVRRPPVIADSSTRSLILSEGQTAELKCYAGGFPHPKISWRRENHNILPTGHSLYRNNILIIPNITKEYRGTYYCIAENGVGRGARRNVAVQVLFAPTVKVLKPFVEQAIQYDVSFECHIEAYPPPVITWVFNKEELSNNQYISIGEHIISDDSLDTSLYITSIRSRQFGEYMCSAKNILGVANGFIQVSESDMPVCPPVCDDESDN